MPVVALVIVCGVLVCAAVSLYLWSRWAGREAAYEPEPLSEEEASIYQLGIHLGGEHGGFNG